MGPHALDPCSQHRSGQLAVHQSHPDNKLARRVQFTARNVAAANGKWGAAFPATRIGSLCPAQDARSLAESYCYSGKNLLEKITGDALEIMAEFQASSQGNHFGFQLRVGKVERTTIGYDVQQQKGFIDRSNSGESSFDKGFARAHSADIAPVNGVIRLHIFLDCS